MDEHKSPAPPVTGEPILLPAVQPFDWQGVIAFLARRVIPGLERLDGERWWRLMSLGGAQESVDGWVRVQAAPRGLSIVIDPRLSGHREAVVRHLRAFFDLDLDPGLPQRVLGDLMRERPGLRMPGALDGFEVGVRAILGQQVSLAAATTLAGRLLARFGRETRCDTAPGRGGRLPDWPVARAFPSPAVLARADWREIAALGMPQRRAQSVQALARLLAGGEVSLTTHADPGRTRERLLALPGIGPWTVEYLAMRALRDRDAFPASDLVLMRALGVRTAAQASARAQGWRPWRSLAVMHLWSAAARAADATAAGRAGVATREAG
ncbi:MAG: AlkA N-terminal domain-containing protein [Burkholderiaceae bacterium]